MSPSGPARGPVGAYLAPIGIALVHAATGVAGLYFGNLAGAVTLFWPPSGIAIAAGVIFGLPGILACAISNFVVNLATTGSLGFSLAACLANTAEASLASTVFRRSAEGRVGLARPHDAGALFVAGAIGALVAALVGSVGAYTFLDREGARFVDFFATWWLGDMSGLLLFAPPILSLASPVPPEPPRLRAPGSGFATAATVAVGMAIAFVPFPGPQVSLPFALVQVVAITFATFRFGARGGHLSAMLIGTACFLGTLQSAGPFFMGTREDSQSILWAGIVLFGGTGLFVASIVAERVAAEVKLVESEERLRALFEHAPNGMVLLDADRRVVLANPAALRMARRDEHEDGSVDAILEDDLSRELADALARGVDRGDRIIEARMRRRWEGEADREFVVRTVVLGAQKKFEGAVVVVEDVTERERERRDHEEMEQQLASAQRLESIGNLAGGIAHDFNNMLQAIRANLELANIFVKRGKDAGPNIDRALGATDRASALTRQLLAFSRRQPARFDRVDVVGTLRSEMALLERLLPEDIHLIFDPRTTNAWVRGDHAQLEQVVLNLVVNGRDAMPKGGEMRIEIETQRFDDTDGGLVRIVVTDQGEGVDPAIRDRIFEPFFTTKPTGRGTGLGLAVVYGIVKSHGGSVHVETTARGGARFVVELPWLHQPESEVDASEPEGEPLEGHGERILLVEDDPLVRAAVCDMLIASSFDVTVASNGADALVEFRAAGGRFDVVVLDVVMPVMGGREAYERLRALDPDVAVVFATGYSEEQIDVGFVLREQVPVVTKPYERAALLSAIAQVTLRRRMADCDVSSPA